MPSRPEFLYFDLGKVLLHFDHRRACRQMAAVSGASEELIWQVVFGSDLELNFERGDLGEAEFHEAFRAGTQTDPDFDRLRQAASDIFWLNASIMPLVASLRGAGHRLGVLSNTNVSHWRFVTRGRFPALGRLFHVHALSFELRSIKPEPDIYVRAAALSQTAPENIFFVDDRPENVAAARQAGFDAVPYTTTAALAADLRARGLGFNF